MTFQASGESADIWAFLWLAMSVGALSLLTPCVFPMVPITVSYFTKHAAGSRRAAISNAVVYSGGIVLTFTALGMLLALVSVIASLLPALRAARVDPMTALRVE